MKIHIQRESLKDLLQAVRDNEDRGFECCHKYKKIPRNYRHFHTSGEISSSNASGDIVYYMSMESHD